MPDPIVPTEPAEQLYTVAEVNKAIDVAVADATDELKKTYARKCEDTDQLQAQWEKAVAELKTLRALVQEQARNCAEHSATVDAVMAATATHRVRNLSAQKARIEAELATLKA